MKAKNYLIPRIYYSSCRQNMNAMLIMQRRSKVEKLHAVPRYLALQFKVLVDLGTLDGLFYFRAQN